MASYPMPHSFAKVADELGRYWTNPVHKTGVEASAEFDGHDLFVKILPR
jgi:hypothetical protein